MYYLYCVYDTAVVNALYFVVIGHPSSVYPYSQSLGVVILSSLVNLELKWPKVTLQDVIT